MGIRQWLLAEKQNKSDTWWRTLWEKERKQILSDFVVEKNESKLSFGSASLTTLKDMTYAGRNYKSFGIIH